MREYTGEERRSPAEGNRDYADTNNFHLKKEITWGHVVTTIFLAGAMVGLYTANMTQHQMADKRITVVEARLEAQHEQMMQVRTSVDNRLTSIDAKLDRLVERMIDK